MLTAQQRSIRLVGVLTMIVANILFLLANQGNR